MRAGELKATVLMHLMVLCAPWPCQRRPDPPRRTGVLMHLIVLGAP